MSFMDSRLVPDASLSLLGTKQLTSRCYVCGAAAIIQQAVEQVWFGLVLIYLSRYLDQETAK